MKKNIFLLPTDKASVLYKRNDLNTFHLGEFDICRPNDELRTNYYIYITSDEEVKVNDYITDGYKVWKWKDNSSLLGRKKVILTIDFDLIKENVQAIDDEFLEWFVKNPSCEFVEVRDYFNPKNIVYGINTNPYKIIIPQEEPKQETLEEAFNRIYNSIDFTEFDFTSFKIGVKWQAERIYSEEEKELMIKIFHSYWFENNNEHEDNLKEWELSKKLFEQFKKK